MERDWLVWPVCPDHHFGLHPVADGRTAVWQCSRGPHSVAAIGSLPPTPTERANGPRAHRGRETRQVRRRPW